MKLLKKATRASRLLTVTVIVVAIVVSAGLLYLFNSQLMSTQANERLAFLTLATEVDKELARAAADDMRVAGASRESSDKKRAEEARKAAEAARNANISTVDPASCNGSTTHNNPASIDVIVNKKHCIQPLTFAPTDLRTSNGATLKTEASLAFDKLFAAATAAGVPIYVTSSYRSYGDQVSTYNHWVGVSGRDQADTYSARPGYSEHQTGLAFDVAASGCVLDCFGTTKQYNWMQENAASYGFIQRYYKGYDSVTGYTAEEWHYRYVGVTVAKDMKAKGIKTLEEYWAISGGDYY